MQRKDIIFLTANATSPQTELFITKLQRKTSSTVQYLMNY